MSGYRLGFDIGGTFTDAALLDLSRGVCHVAKVLTTPDDPARGAMEAMTRLLEMTGVGGAELDAVIHATTLVANAIIERKGARTGLLTTRGFRDTLHVRREIRYDSYNLNPDWPEPLVPRQLIREVGERILADGTTWQALDVASAESAAKELVAAGVQSIAVCLIHSYQNDEHEQRLKEVLQRVDRTTAVSLSSEVVPEFREYERTSTTVANAYVKPLVRDYLTTLDRELRKTGHRNALYMMLSAGGIIDAATAQDAPIRIAESGPAAGALVTGYLGTLAGYPHLIAFDMGGTTAKASVIDQGRPLMARDFEIARVHRFRKGSGIPVRLPVVDMIEIGAGGGSIASLDQMNLLKVGPLSAGADPGPACYGRGGTVPTVTDALVLLGYLNPDYFAAGTMTLDRDAAERAISTQIAGPLQLSATDAAWGIYRVVNENMASAVRVYLAEKGRDPRGYTISAFGGAGPAHVREVARPLRIRQIICPPAAGVLSAIGLLVAPPVVDLAQTYFTSLERADWTQINTIFQRMETQAGELLERAGVQHSAIHWERSADLRFAGQAHELTSLIPLGPLGAGSRDAIERSFFATYDKVYGSHHQSGSLIHALSWRLRAVGPAPTVSSVAWGRENRQDASPLKGARAAYFGDAGRFVECDVYDRYQLRPGMDVAGPALVEEDESVVVLGPRDRGRIDAYGNLVLTIGGNVS
jgi:N-methylhydantoinase A/oxoprolinase/acetone carboxylase beta subunit